METKTHIQLLIILAIALVGLNACRNSGTGPHYWNHWDPLNPESDLLIDSLDSPFIGDDPGNYHRLADRLDSLASHTSNRQLKARAAYWKGVTAAMDMDYEKTFAYVGRALELCDSAAYPYDWARFISFTDMDLQAHGEKMATTMKSAEVFREHNDSTNFGSILFRLNLYMLQNGDTVLANRIGDRAEQVFLESNDSLSLYTIRKERLRSAYLEAGKFREGAPLADRIMKMDEFSKSGSERALVFMFEYYLTRRKEWLYKAAAAAGENENDLAARTVTAGEMAKMHYREGNIDSARYYHRIFRLRGDTGGGWEVEQTFELGAELARLSGDSALADEMEHGAGICRAVKRGMKQGNPGLTGEERSKVERLINEPLGRASQDVRPWWWIGFGIVLVAIIIVGSAAVMRRRNGKARHNAAVDSPQRETVSEGSPRLESSTEDTASLEKARKAVHSIRMALREDGGGKDAERIFDGGSPMFEVRLRKDYPSITNAEMRMAKFTSLGISTTEIAGLLFLTTDSVKKGRQRLRQRLGASPSSDLAFLLLPYHD